MRLYTKDHTWIVADGTLARIGISDFAQAELGDIAYVELPQIGRLLQRGEVACTVDSLKSSSEIYAPLSGSVTEVNAILSSEERCGAINRDPYGEGWLFAVAMADAGELEFLLSEADYAAYTRGS
jgi:glycine cleavage system H protein